MAAQGLAVSQTEAQTSAESAKTAPSATAAKTTAPSTAPKTAHHSSATTRATSAPKASSHKTSSRKNARASSRKSADSHGKKVATKRGQQAIDSSRAREIQAALIRQNYMKGEPTGAWDNDTQDAMRRYQLDHGWQSKTIPDSRALIRLGLGPSSDHLLNPESAMTATPASGDPKLGVQPIGTPGPPQDLPKQ